jgi:hypothetical protein
MFGDKYDYVLVLIMMMILNVGDLFMVVNSYMQIGCDIGDDCMYEKCRCLCW